MQVGERIETVEPNKKGFLTGPRSEISRLFGKQGVICIGVDCANHFYENMKKNRLMQETNQIKRWLTIHGAAQGGILYGEIAPGKEVGWYVVLMMQMSKWGGYIDYADPGSQFLGKQHTLCEEIFQERGIDGVYNNGVEFFVTNVSGQEVVRIIESRKI